MRVGPVSAGEASSMPVDGSERMRDQAGRRSAPSPGPQGQPATADQIDPGCRRVLYSFRAPLRRRRRRRTLHGPHRRPPLTSVWSARVGVDGTVDHQGGPGASGRAVRQQLRRSGVSTALTTVPATAERGRHLLTVERISGACADSGSDGGDAGQAADPNRGEPVGGGAVAELAVTVVTPGVDGAVAAQGISAGAAGGDGGDAVQAAEPEPGRACSWWCRRRAGRKRCNPRRRRCRCCAGHIRCRIRRRWW